MHRVCGIIHTDLKPENVVFALTEREKFEMLYNNVICTPLFELFETSTPIILNKKQLANQKKKERKKKKKEQSKQENNEDDEEEENKNQEKTTKTEAVCKEFDAKIAAAEAHYLMVPEMKRQRTNSFEPSDMGAHKFIFGVTKRESELPPMKRPPQI